MHRFNSFIQTWKLIIYFIRKSRLFGVVLCNLMICSTAYSQGKLAHEIQQDRFENTSLRALFTSLQEKHAVQFSFNSNLLDLDQTISTDAFQGLLIDYLEKLLGEKYSFKETDSHIIIRYAPQRMAVTSIDMDTVKNNRARISGYVKDIRSDRPLDLATVYDLGTFHTSTLTGKNGYFELDVRNPNRMVSIALSKENYRDTMIILIFPVEISHVDSEKRTGFYPSNSSRNTIAKSYMGRLFTNSRQRIQNLNLGGFFVHSPVQLSLTPGLGTHGFFNSQVVNKFSLNLIGGYAAGVEGVELGGAFNINQFDMSGFQLGGLFNVVGGNVKGFQGAGGSNVALNQLHGSQVAGIWNRADTIVSGIQIAGALNIASEGKHALQIAGLSNIANGYVGNQLSGGVNIAKKVKGVQLGLVNIADSSDYSIGLFNWIKNGSRSFSLGIDESKFVNLQFKTGGRVLYSVLGFGSYLDNPVFQYGVEFGLGGYLLKKNHFSLSTELVHRSHFDKNLKYFESNRTSVRIIPSLRLGNHFALFAAPSLSYTEANHQENNSKEVVWNFWGSKPAKNTMHGGGVLGFTYHF